MNETEVKELFASAVAHPAFDRIDVDAAIRGGRRRHRGRVAAAMGSALAVLAVVGVLVTGSLPARQLTTVNPVGPSGSTPAGAPVTSPAQLMGRWMAQSVAGRDLTAYRDRDGNPVTLTFGAQGDVTTWETTGACSPQIGVFSVAGDGSFRAEYRGPLTFVACPSLEKVAPDATGAISAARFLTLTPATGAAPATLQMLDAQRNVLAVWRANAGAA